MSLERSQAYVSYIILPKDDLPENTNIKKSAGIYFESNPPIITNTVQNVLVNEISSCTNVIQNVVNADNYHVTVFPNSSIGIFHISLKGKPLNKAKFSIYN